MASATKSKAKAKPKDKSAARVKEPLSAKARSFIWDTDRIAVVHIPDPGAANADLANFPLIRAPKDIVIKKATHVPSAVWVAAAPANDATVVLKNNNVGTVATLAVQSALAQGSKNDMGAITNATIQEGDWLTVDITTNGTANAPDSLMVIEYQYDY